VSILAACAPASGYRPPSDLREYRILVTRTDSLSLAISRGLERRGFTVRHAVQGGSPPTAYLLSFSQRETEKGSLRWLYIRLADTRSGVVLATVAGPLDSLGASVDARAQAIVDSLTIQRAALRVPQPRTGAP